MQYINTFRSKTGKSLDAKTDAETKSHKKRQVRAKAANPLGVFS